MVLKRVRHGGENTLFAWMEQLIRQYEKSGRERAAESYTTTLNSFKAFRGGRDVRLGKIDAGLIGAYEAYLRARGVTMNTVSFYMRILRAVYNRAVADKLTVQRNPFREVYTGVAKTVKRALSQEALRRIKALDLGGQSAGEFARDMFLFSLYTRGMSFVDMAYLRKTDLANGILTYRRRKTGQPLAVKWERCMQEIVDRHVPATASPYLLPIIRRPGSGERSQYKNALYAVNKQLKQIAVRLSLPGNLTMYVARHSWASIARSKHVPLSVISEGMGHDSVATTQIYLASLNASDVDEANELILKSI